MKAKYFLVLMVLGLGLGVIGVLSKIQHWPGASWLLLTSLVLDLVGVAGFVTKTLGGPQPKDSPNR